MNGFPTTNQRKTLKFKVERLLVSLVVEQPVRVESVNYLMVQNALTTAKRKNDVPIAVVET